MAAIQIIPGVGYDDETGIYITDFVLNADGTYTGGALAPSVTAEQLFAIASDKTSRSIAALVTETGSSPVTQQKILGIIQHTTGYLTTSLAYIGTVSAKITEAETALPVLNLVKNGLVAMFSGAHPTIKAAIDKLEEIVIPAAKVVEEDAVAATK